MTVEGDGGIADTVAALSDHRTRRWLADHVDLTSPYEVTALSGGNSNVTCVLTDADDRRFVVRRPPSDPLAPSAHNLQREFRILAALQDTDAPAPAAIALCEADDVTAAPFMAMGHHDGHPLTDELPAAYPDDADTIRRIGTEAVDGLARLHQVDWQAVGLSDFGRPEGFLDRQIPRWTRQYERHEVRDLPRFAEVAAGLQARLPAAQEPAILHGDFHLDNTLFGTRRPELVVIIDWEMATIGDPMLDLGLLLAFWGPRSIDGRPAMPHVQGVSRRYPAIGRQALADRYAEATGRDVSTLPFYMALAFWKLASIIEGAYALHLQGRLDTEYVRQLEFDVPLLLDEAAAFLDGFV